MLSDAARTGAEEVRAFGAGKGGFFMLFARAFIGYTQGVEAML